MLQETYEVLGSSQLMTDLIIKGPRGALPKFYGLEVVWDAEKTLVK